MAETLRIEIPIEAVDKTESGVQAATRRLTAFEQSMERTRRQLLQFDRTSRIGLEVEDNATDRMADVEDQADRIDSIEADVDVSVSNAASDAISDIEGQAEALDGTSSDVDVGANDTATGILGGVEDRAETVDGMSADVDVGASDNATPAISAAGDAVEAFDGQSGSADIGVSDNATPTVSAARDAVEEFSGSSGEAEIGANDTASPVIDGVRDKAAAWDGSVWTATVGVVDAVTSPISKITGALSNPLTQAGAMLGVTVGLNDTVNTYKSFESMMSQVQAISGATGSDLEALTAKAKEMGATTKFTATESAEAMNYMAMAGWKTSDMISGIPGIMNLAAASGESLGSTSDIVTDALTAFGLKASDSTHFADVLAQASANANTNVGMLGESFKYVAPVAGAMNYSIEDTSLALGLMANASVKGSMAGTALKTSLANMASPTDSMAEAMEKYGISLTDSEGNMKSLGDVITNLRTSLGGLSETEQTAAASTIFGKEAMAGMLAIINASEEDYNKLSDAIYNADGAAQQMSETMLDNLEGSLTLMQSAVDGVKTSFGERLSPYIRGIADMITEAMPGAETALTGLMDFVDGKAAGIKRSIDSMMNSDDWKNADLFGKVNIAWDKIVAEPFTKWAGSKGKNTLSKGLSSLFTEASKIMPGGEEAGVMSWLSAGIIAKGATSAISGAQGIVSALAPIGSAIKGVASAASGASSVGGFISSLGEMIPTAGKVGLAAAAITAAVAAIGVAINNYNQQQISNSLSDHFGQISLSAKEAEEAASGILNAKYLVNVELALGEFTNADQMRETAEKALQSNQVLTWKSSVGIELTADEQAEYTDNITTFVDSKIAELESRTFAAHVSVQTFLGGTEEGQDLASSIEEWARADDLELTNLSNDLKTAVEEALKDGIIDVDEAQAVAALQEKISGITNRWKQAEAQAQLDWINQEYGSLSGKDLTSESFTSVVEALGSQREAAAEETASLAKEFYAYLNAAESSGRITGTQSEQYKELAGQAIRNQKASDLMTSLSFENNTLNGTYGSKIQENMQKAQESIKNQMEILQMDAADGMLGFLATDLYSGMDSANAGDGMSGVGPMQWVSDEDQAALAGIWETMKPDASAMSSLIDEYVKAGQEVPKQIMDNFNETMAIGAASGDTEAAWQVYAKQIADTGDKALIDAINQMDADGQLGDEFSAAWKRATADVTTDPVELNDVKMQVDGVDVDKQEWLDTIQQQLGDLGTVTAATNADVEVTVNKGDCLSQIGEAVGVDWHEIAAYNGIEDPYTIYPGMQVKIPLTQADVDTSQIPEAIQEAVSSLETGGNQVEVQGSDIEVTLGEVAVEQEDALAKVAEAVGMTLDQLKEYNGLSNDTEVDVGMKIRIPMEQIDVDTADLQSAVDQTVQEASSVEPAEVDATANVTVEAETVDTSGVQTAAQESLDGSEGNASATMSADVTVEAGEVDAAGAKASADAEIDEAFSETHQTTGSTNVTLEQTNNSAEVYSQVGSDLQGAMSAGYSVSTNASIHVNYNIANPTASISFSGGGTGSATVSASLHAAGGEVGQNGPELSWVGEEGLEYIIPTVPSRRGRGIALWEQAGQALGILDSDGQIAAHANGGIVGPGGREIVPNDSIIPLVKEAQQGEDGENIWSVTGQVIGAGTSQNNGEGEQAKTAVFAAPQGQGTTVEISVDLKPVIEVKGDGADPEKIFDVVKERIRELADELGDEIGERMFKIFDNMPLVGEA